MHGRNAILRPHSVPSPHLFLFLLLLSMNLPCFLVMYSLEKLPRLVFALFFLSFPPILTLSSSFSLFYILTHLNSQALISHPFTLHLFLDLLISQSLLLLSFMSPYMNLSHWLSYCSFPFDVYIKKALHIT